MDLHCPDCGSDDLWGDGWGALGEKIVRCEHCGRRSFRDSGDPVHEQPTVETSPTPERKVDGDADEPAVEIIQPRPRMDVIRDIELLRNACLDLLAPELPRPGMAGGPTAEATALDLGHCSSGRLIAAAHRCVRTEYRDDPDLKCWRLDLRNWYWHASTRSDLYRSPREADIFKLWQQERRTSRLAEFSDDDLWVPLRFVGVREDATSEPALPRAPRGYWDGMPRLPPGRPPSVPLSQSGGYHPGSVPAEEQWPGRR